MARKPRSWCAPAATEARTISLALPLGCIASRPGGGGTVLAGGGRIGSSCIKHDDDTEVEIANSKSKSVELKLHVDTFM